MPSFKATYTDGRTAKPYQVSAEILGGVLFIRDGEGGPQRASWPLANIHLVGDPRDGQLPRLQNLDGPDRLTLSDTMPLTILGPVCPNLNRHAYGRSRDTPKSIAMLVGGAAASLVLIFFVIIPVIAGVVADRIPESWEERLGQTAESQIARVLALKTGKNVDQIRCHSAPADALLGNLTLAIAGDTDLADGINLQIWDVPIANAFAMPGKRVVLLTGLIEEAETAEEVVGVLAHELGHVAERHVLERLVQVSASSFLIGALLGDLFGGAALAGIGEALISSSYSRDAEREADTWSVDALNRLDIRADGMVDLFERFSEEEDPDSPLNYFSTHPLSEDRARYIRENATGRGYAMTATEWQALRNACG